MQVLINPLNQDQMQTLANNIKDLIHLISRVPDLRVLISHKMQVIQLLRKLKQNHYLTL